MPYLVEVWCEKTTMNDVLVPLCRKRRVNLVAGAGEMSETQTRLLMERAIAASKPVRIFYVSDFDPAGRSMPVAVSRRIEFYLVKNDYEVDMQLIPLVLSAQQCQEYNLPRTPIKETERRAARFEAQFGEGATELDALEALHPGTLEKLTDQAISRYLSPDYARDFYAAATEYRAALRAINERAEQLVDLDDLRGTYEDLIEQWDAFAEALGIRFADIKAWFEQHAPDPFVPPPFPAASEHDDAAVLFDSRRDYLSQLDAYRTFKEPT